RGCVRPASVESLKFSIARTAPHIGPAVTTPAMLSRDLACTAEVRVCASTVDACFDIEPLPLAGALRPAIGSAQGPQWRASCILGRCIPGQRSAADSQYDRCARA